MIHPGASTTAPVRAVFVIDPNQTLRAMIYYPLTTGRSIDEILRLIDALQLNTEKGLATPANRLGCSANGAARRGRAWVGHDAISVISSFRL